MAALLPMAARFWLCAEDTNARTARRKGSKSRSNPGPDQETPAVFPGGCADVTRSGGRIWPNRGAACRRRSREGHPRSASLRASRLRRAPTGGAGRAMRATTLCTGPKGAGSPTRPSTTCQQKRPAERRQHSPDSSDDALTHFGLAPPRPSPTVSERASARRHSPGAARAQAAHRATARGRPARRVARR